jgi:hypothetical protein
MQVVCPNCGESVSSENINIQRMSAVCPECDTVFEFDPTVSKTKRRKVKQPEHLTLNEADGQLSMAFRTNFRLDKNQTFLSLAGLSIVFTFIAAIFDVRGSTNAEAAIIFQGLQVLLIFLYYSLGLMLWNKTHIEINHAEIKISRKPLPNVLTQPNKINVAGIEKIYYEETAASKKDGYDTPRFDVWAKTEGGHRRLIVGDVVEDYAVFIAQQLNEYLAPDTTDDVSRLLDENSRAVEDTHETGEEVLTRAESSRP